MPHVHTRQQWPVCHAPWNLRDKHGVSPGSRRGADCMNRDGQLPVALPRTLADLTGAVQHFRAVAGDLPVPEPKHARQAEVPLSSPQSGVASEHQMTAGALVSSTTRPQPVGQPSYSTSWSRLGLVTYQVSAVSSSRVHLTQAQSEFACRLLAL